MTERKATNRRQQFIDAKDQGEDLDQTPLELPMGTRIPKISMAQEIQQQIAIQLAKKKSGASN